MSFGWSAGDIAFALNVLYKAGSALKESGGASSSYQDASSFLESLQKTLEQLRVFSSTTLETSSGVELRRAVSQVRVPVTRFVEDIQKFEPALGARSSRGKLLGGPRKMQWALQMPVKLQKLREQITAPLMTLSILLGLNVLNMVSNIRNDLPSQIHTEFSKALQEHFPTLLHNALEPWAAIIKENHHDALALHKQSADNKMSCMEEQQTFDERNVQLQNKAVVVEIQNLQATLQTIGVAIGKTFMSEDAHKPDYQRDFVHAVASYHGEPRNINSTFGRIPAANVDRVASFHRDSDDDVHLELRDLGRELRLCAWLLILNLQELIHKLLKILLPFFVAIFKSAAALPSRLLLPGEHFFFEDALGHMHKLPTLQFQHWNAMSHYLQDVFKGLPGFGRVLSRQFQVFNAYNGVPIDPSTWQTLLQPGFRFNMAMLLDGTTLMEDRCPHCRVKIKPVQNQNSMQCKLCKKHITLMPPKRLSSTETGFLVSKIEPNERQAYPDVHAGSVRIDSVNLSRSSLPMNPSISDPRVRGIENPGFQPMSCEENEIKAFKRVAWEPGTFKHLTIIYEPGAHVADIDIIAIHALDGHPWTSFSADFDSSDPYSKEINWLKDILSQALHEQGITARIMAFGYDSERWLRGPPRDMDMPSNDLLSNLESERFARFVDPNRPTMFIGHGLGTHIAKDAMMFMHPRVSTGLAAIVETDDIQPAAKTSGASYFEALSTKHNREIGWLYPGLRKSNVASFYAKKLEIASLADRFNKMRFRACPAVPFHQFARYQPREGVERQWLMPDLMSAKMVEKNYIDLSKYTRETKNHFAECFIPRLIQMARTIRNLGSNEGLRPFSTQAKVSVPCKPTNIFLIDDSGTLTDTRWSLAGNILLGAAERLCGGHGNHESLDVRFFHNYDQNRRAIEKFIAAYDVVYHWRPSSEEEKTTAPFKKELLPFLREWRDGMLTPTNLVILTDMKLTSHFYDFEDSMAEILTSDVCEMARELLHIQICHIGHDLDNKRMFEEFTERMSSRYGNDRFDRSLMSFVQCTSSADLTDAFYRKLLLVERVWRSLIVP